MAPNLRFEHDDDDFSLGVHHLPVVHPIDNLQLKKKESARALWKNLQLSQELLSSNDPLVRALSSIRLLDSQESSQPWLNRFDGELYNISRDLLEQVASKSPNQFAARVADCNENLFYEMQTRKGLAHLGLEDISSVVLAEEYLGSFLTTESTVPQPAHVDYTWETINDSSNLNLGFFPLTNEGMFLQVWPRNDDVDQIFGELVFIPEGRLLVLPASTIHGGGFRTTPYNDHGNLRFHLYMARGKGSKLPPHQSNKYTEPYDKRRELCERYVNTHHMELLQKHFFL